MVLSRLGRNFTGPPPSAIPSEDKALASPKVRRLPDELTGGLCHRAALLREIVGQGRKQLPRVGAHDGQIPRERGQRGAACKQPAEGETCEIKDGPRRYDRRWRQKLPKMPEFVEKGVSKIMEQKQKKESGFNLLVRGRMDCAVWAGYPLRAEFALVGERGSAFPEVVETVIRDHVFIGHTARKAPFLC